MNDHQGFTWNIFDVVSGIAFGALGLLGAAFGWMNNRFKIVHTRMDTMEKLFTQRDQDAALQIVQLRAYHEDNQRRLNTIENNTGKINDKLDRLIDGMLDGGKS